MSSSQAHTLLNVFFRDVGITATIPPNYDTKNFYSDIIRGLLNLKHLHRGRISCLLSVKPAVTVDHIKRGRVSCLLCVKAVVTNAYGGLHGGAVAAVAEMVAVACARTVVGKDKELFLGELSMSYLSAAPRDVEVIVDASVVRSGRNLTVVAVEFRIKESEKLAFTSRATFYNMAVASL